MTTVMYIFLAVLAVAAMTACFFFRTLRNLKEGEPQEHRATEQTRTKTSRH